MIIIIIIGIIVFYQNCIFYREKNAEIAIYPCQIDFSNQKWEVALNGDRSHIGFLAIMKKFKKTNCAELAKAYAGICQYQLGNYREALNTLKSYHGKDQLFTAQIIGAVADCEVNLGNIKKGIKYFLKAVNKAKSSLLSPIFLKKTAIAYENLKDYKSALKIYRIIITEYPQSFEAAIVKKDIERVKERFK